MLVSWLGRDWWRCLPVPGERGGHNAVRAPKQLEVGRASEGSLNSRRDPAVVARRSVVQKGDGQAELDRLSCTMLPIG